MFIKPLLKTAALAPVLGLAACGGSSTETTLIGPFSPNNGLPFATVNNQTVAVATVSGTEFSAGTTTAGWQNATGTSSTGSVEFTIINANTIQMKQGADTWTFRNQGGSPVEVWLADSAAGDGPTTLSAVFGQGSTAPGGLRSIFFGSISSPPQVAGAITFTSDIYAVSGFETNPAEVDALSATANYQGPAQIVARTGASDTTAGDILEGTLDINIDFAGSNAVTGTLNGNTDAEFGGGTLDLTLAPTTIASGDNNFSTTFSKTGGTNTQITGFTNTDVSGTLYGVDAAELGVVIKGDAAVTGTGTLPTAGFGLGQKQ